MSKNYFPLLTVLAVLATLVGSFAIYRSFTTPTPKPLITPKPVVLSAATKEPTSSPSATPIPKIPLTITSPLAEASVSSSLLIVSGQTATEAAVTVNDKTIFADTQGAFRTSLRLTSGPNLVVITASSSSGTNIWQTVVNYVP